MDGDVCAPDLVEDRGRIRLRLAEPRWHHRAPRLVLEIRAVERSELHQLGEVERAVDPVDLPVLCIDASGETLDHLGGRRGAHLDADGIPEAAFPQLTFHGLEQVVGIVGDLEIPVARDAEGSPLDDRYPGKE